MGQRLAVLIVMCLAAGSMPAWCEAQSLREDSSKKVLAFFEAHGGDTIDAFLMRLRPAPLDPASRSRVLASLPHGFEVRASRKMTEKIAAAERILNYTARNGVITVKVLNRDEAFAGLYYRAVLLVSSRTLDILNADEFAAMAAHEVAHDYNWGDYWTAIQQMDYPRMRELELRSDGIAVLTLERVGIDPERLVSAAQKLTHCNEWREGASNVEPGDSVARGTRDRYVPLKERVAFIRAVARLPWADRPATEAR
jgi:hypothetical protein